MSAKKAKAAAGTNMPITTPESGESGTNVPAAPVTDEQQWRRLMASLVAASGEKGQQILDDWTGAMEMRAQIKKEEAEQASDQIDAQAIAQVNCILHSVYALADEIINGSELHVDLACAVTALTIRAGIVLDRQLEAAGDPTSSSLDWADMA